MDNPSNLTTASSLTLSSLNGFDWLLVIILAWSTITAFLRGIVLEIFTLLGLLAGILIAGWEYQRIAAHLSSLLTPFLHLADTTWNILSFLLVAVGVMIVATISARLIRSTAHTLGLGFFDRLLGGLFGLMRGYLVIVALLAAATAFMPKSQAPARWVANSHLVPYFLGGVHALSFVVPQGLQQQLLNGIAQLKHSAPDWIKLPR